MVECRPMTPLYILIGVAITGICFIAWQQWKSQTDGDPRLKAELDRRTQEIGELKAQMEQLKTEKNELATNGKSMFAQLKNLESDYKALMKEREGLTSRLAKFEAEEDRKQKKYEEMVDKQEEARKALEDERMRIRREDEQRQEQELAERDRMWNEHEQSVVALLSDLTKKEHCKFPSFSNTDLPEGFSGSLKPDFMVEFLEQYIIFDAKVSRSQDLQNYIKDAVKKTATKIKGNAKIYSTVFLVVPTDAIADLKQQHFYEEGYSFYVVSPEALEPILASLKRIETYEFAEAMDPQERESIIDMIAAFLFHIQTRNANEFGLMLHGLETMEKAKKLNPTMIAEAITKKAKMRHLNLSTADTKQLVQNPEEVAQQLLELVEPDAKIKKEDLKNLG